MPYLHPLSAALTVSKLSIFPCLNLPACLFCVFGVHCQGVDEGAKGIVLKTAKCSPDRYVVRHTANV